MTTTWADAAPSGPGHSPTGSEQGEQSRGVTAAGSLDGAVIIRQGKRIKSKVSPEKSTQQDRAGCWHTYNMAKATAGCPGWSSRGAAGAISRGCMAGGSRSGQRKPVCVLRAPISNHLEYQPARLAVLRATLKLRSWLALALRAQYTAEKCQSPEHRPAAGIWVGSSCTVALSVPCLVPPSPLLNH